MNSPSWLRKSTGALLCAGAVALAGCNSQQPTAAAPPAASSSSAAPAPAGSGAQAAAPYTPPSADQLYQLVAPIALFPDKLVAQVLAGSTYPDQITSADGVVSQNPNLKGTELQTAIAQQPWDPSVKGLTAFPSVLDQMAKNIDWTTALGEAYVNDPTDVMNAIQVMRQRASKHGTLHNSPQMRVVTQAAAAPPSDNTEDDYASDDQGGDNGYPEYDGPDVVPAPQQIIEIEPAQSDTVYVPQYDYQTVYGEEISNYPGYVYERPREYSTGEVVGVGAVTFGVGVLVGALFEHQHEQSRVDRGWNNWGMHWRNRGNGNDNGNKNGGWQRPAVVYNNTRYVSRSTTVVNRYVTSNINNSRNVTYNNSNNRRVTTVNDNQRQTAINNNQRTNAVENNQRNDDRRINNPGNRGAPAFAAQAAAARAGAARAAPAAEHRPMSVPNFGAHPGRAVPQRAEPLAARAAAEPTSRNDIPRPGSAMPPHARSPYALRAATAAPARPEVRPASALARAQDRAAPRAAEEQRAARVAQRSEPDRVAAPTLRTDIPRPGSAMPPHARSPYALDAATAAPARAQDRPAPRAAEEQRAARVAQRSEPDRVAAPTFRTESRAAPQVRSEPRAAPVERERAAVQPARREAPQQVVHAQQQRTAPARNRDDKQHNDGH